MFSLMLKNQWNGFDFYITKEMFAGLMDGSFVFCVNEKSVYRRHWFSQNTPKLWRKNTF